MHIKGSKEYRAGLFPDASAIAIIILLSNRALVNLAAVAAGIPLFDVNLLFLKTGLTLMAKLPISGYTNPSFDKN